MEFIEDHEISNPSSEEMMDMIRTGGETGHMGSEEEEEESEASIEEDWPDRPHTKETSFLLSTHRAWWMELESWPTMATSPPG